MGSTAKAMTDSAEIEQIDIVDISRDILDANSIVYPDPRELPLNDPRVTVFIEDGRFCLLTSTETYDSHHGGASTSFDRRCHQPLHSGVFPASSQPFERRRIHDLLASRRGFVLGRFQVRRKGLLQRFR